MPGKSILMLIGEFSEEYEIFVVQQAMEAVGHTVDIICPDTKAGDRVTTSLHDFGPHVRTYTETTGHVIETTQDFDTVQTDGYDAVYVAGGRGPEYIRTYPRVLEILREFHRDDKVIASICHGAQVLAAAKVLEGKSCSAYPACAPDVTAAGGTWVDIGFEAAHVDGNLITAAAWPAQSAWIGKILEALGTKIEL